jgi:hypothetical protein
MKKMNILAIITIIITIVLFMCTIDDFLALHDIKKDYVSKDVLQYLKVNTSKELPAWTNTELEWLSIKVSYVIRFVFIIVNLLLLIRLRKEIQNKCTNK